tara:strand:- start:78 stop:527 length:450 start_codon:yes stop_codon:yes gene_type:complete
MIKTFRGLIADGGQDIVSLHTNTGSTGYRITKFQIISNLTMSATATIDHVLKIFKIPQTTVPTAGADIDLSDNTLVGVATLSQGSTPGVYSQVVIFDHEIFNQDIYITHTDNDGTDPCNYYIELEQVKLDLSENTVATLKDIRNITAPV